MDLHKNAIFNESTAAARGASGIDPMRANKVVLWWRARVTRPTRAESKQTSIVDEERFVGGNDNATGRNVTPVCLESVE